MIKSTLNSSHFQIKTHQQSVLFEKKTLSEYLKTAYFNEDIPISENAITFFREIPTETSIEDLTNLIFDICHPIDILNFLKIIFYKYPNASLSPYNTIRKEIIEDYEHNISNNLLEMKLKKANSDTEENREKCYDLAYRVNHPNLYATAPTSIGADEYTINFLWINLNPQNRIKDEDENIFENIHLLTKSNTQKNIACRIVKWAKLNPKTQINIWYDSALVTQKAQKNTFQIFQKIAQRHQIRLTLRDIRCLPNIQGIIRDSLHPGSPLYYRVDMLKILIADHMISNFDESARYCIMSDLDVYPMPSKQIFDKRTLEYLSSYGYVFNKNGVDNFENNFFIFDREKDTPRIRNHTMIQNITRLIESLRYSKINSPFPRDYTMGSQSVFKEYKEFTLEEKDKKNPPRKVVKSPPSQFNFGGDFSLSDHQSESFRFIGKEITPYTKLGRAFSKCPYQECQIFENWEAIPLPPPYKA